MSNRVPTHIKLTILVIAAVTSFFEYEIYLSGNGFSITLLVVSVGLCVILARSYKVVVAAYNNVVIPVTSRFKELAVEGQRRYNELPTLGKIRVDEQDSKFKWRGKLVGSLVTATIAFAITPIGGMLVSIGIVGYIKRAWNERRAESKAIVERRSEALPS